ncbi:hypothetical protein QR680_003385 [Steinernema hermaphroditum]|uniref:BolA-like protein n=1 Tax=Steinernema hermaphroditum TaxID=289476 RepID=A0AA39H7G2_9BILA|nr:hypothetical protein QR680_003385 [Steinernema hermaphroditum]
MIRRMASMAANVAAEGPVQQLIRQKLTNHFQPTHLDIVCESNMHNVPKGAEKHFKVQIVSEKFEGVTIIQRHRMVNACLSEELAGPVHALRIDAHPPSKFTGQKPAPSPSCRGGGHL